MLLSWSQLYCDSRLLKTVCAPSAMPLRKMVGAFLACTRNIHQRVAACGSAPLLRPMQPAPANAKAELSPTEMKMHPGGIDFTSMCEVVRCVMRGRPLTAEKMSIHDRAGRGVEASLTDVVAHLAVKRSVNLHLSWTACMLIVQSSRDCPYRGVLILRAHRVA